MKKTPDEVRTERHEKARDERVAYNAALVNDNSEARANRAFEKARLRALEPEAGASEVTKPSVRTLMDISTGTLYVNVDAPKERYADIKNGVVECLSWVAIEEKTLVGQFAVGKKTRDGYQRVRVEHLRPMPGPGWTYNSETETFDPPSV